MILDLYAKFLIWQKMVNFLWHFILCHFFLMVQTNFKSKKICKIQKKLKPSKFSCYSIAWYDAGITKISDILNQNQKFLKWHEFVTKFNLNVPFTTYYGLVNAIPKDWKAILTNPIPNVTHANTTVNSLRTSSIYSSLLLHRLLCLCIYQ